MTQKDKQSNSSKKGEPKEIDFAAIRKNARDKENPDPWLPDLGVFDNLTNLLLSSTILPDEEIQIPIIAAYLMLPHPVLELAPILWVLGSSGSGKSQILCIAKFLNEHNVTVFANSSAVGIRNTINDNRFINYDPRDPEKEPKERHFLMVIDNAPAGYARRDENTQLMLIQGSTRGTDETRISGEKTGSVMVFRTFSRKLISSVAPVNDKEVFRRTLLVECKKTNSSEVTDLINFTTLEYNWTKYFLSHWNYDNLVRFKELQLEYPKHEFTGDKNRILYYRGVWAILVMSGVENPMEIVNAFEGRDIMRIQDTTLEQALSAYVRESLNSPLAISNSSLMSFINVRVRDEDFDRPSMTEIETVMGDLGYKKKLQPNGGFKWEQ